MAASPKAKLGSLTSFRFLFCIQVLLFHYGGVAFGRLPTSLAWADSIRVAAAPAVSFFFCLSGFLLTRRYLQPIADHRISRWQFWRARSARIYPLYLVALLIDAAQMSLPPDTTPPDVGAVFLVQLFGVQAWTSRLVWAGNLPGWSISVELFCYFLFPFLAPVAIRLGRGRAKWVMAIAWLAALIPPLVYLAFKPDRGIPQGHHADMVWLNLVKFCPLLRLPEFIVGIGVALLLADDEARDRRRPGTALALLALAVVVAVEANQGRFPHILLHNSLLTPAFALLILGLAHGGLVARLLAWSPLVLLGDLSYGMYLFQMPLYKLVSKSIGGESWEARPHFLLQYILLLIGVAAVAHFLIEEPAHRLLLARRSATVYNPRA